MTLLPWTAEGLEGLALDDLDGDGRAEALLFVNTHLAVLADLDGPAPTLRIDHVLDEGDLRPHARTLVGDFDGDGSRDLAFLDHRELTLVRGVDGGFAGVAPTVDTALSASLDVADLEGDGRTEVLTAASDEVRVFEAVDVLLPKTSARLDLPHPSQDLLGPVEPVFGDFNGDGRVDALYTIGPSLTIAWGDDGRFRESVSTSWVSVAALAAADLDGDGRDEALLTRLSKTSTLHWDGAALVIRGPDEGWTHPHVAARPGAADLDGDGVAEPLLVRRPSLDTPSFAIIRLLPSGESEEIFTAPTADPFACARQPCLEAGDLDGDGRDELVVVDGCGEVALRWNDGEGRLRPDPLAASAALIQGVGDLVAVRGSTLVRIAVDGRSLGDSTPIHRQVADLREVGDCNGDGRPDLLSVFASGAAVLLGSADDSFVDLGAVEAATTRCVDVDDDGLADLVSLKTSVIATRLRRGAP
ncbi:MAG: VCBS repeat-containing protein [Myxococcales bacterium]|nr:VCBS repeat-containing protein [Myxococcales bacterium]